MAHSAHPAFAGYWHPAVCPRLRHRINLDGPAMPCRLLLALALMISLPAVDVAAQPPTPYLTAEFNSGGTAPTYDAFLRGTQARIIATIRKCLGSVPGCPFQFERSSLYFHLPPGLAYVSHLASTPLNPATCTTRAAPDGGQFVACTGGSVVGYQGSNWQAQLTLHVDVAADMALGPLRLVMAVDDNLPAQSLTLAECMDDIFPNYCDDFSSVVGVAPSPALIIEQTWHVPSVFEPDEAASIKLFARNTGNLAGTGTHLQINLPPGFQWLLANTSSVGPLMACTATGTWNAGQTVTCSGTGLPATASGTVQLNLGIRPRGGMEHPGPLPVLASVNDGAAPLPAVLLACASDPSPAHCAWLEVPTFVPCAYAHADGIFCNGFELPQAVTVDPAHLAD